MGSDRDRSWFVGEIEEREAMIRRLSERASGFANNCFLKSPASRFHGGESLDSSSLSPLLIPGVHVFHCQVHTPPPRKNLVLSAESKKKNQFHEIEILFWLI